MKTIVFRFNYKFHHAEAQRRREAQRIIWVLLFAVLFLFGCSEPKDSGALNGTWSDGWGTMIINSSAKTIEYDSGFGFAYEGEIVNNPSFTSATGVLIIKFIEYKNWLDENVPENKNKFGALYWNNLTENSVLMADANTDGGLTHVIKGTLEEAQTAFTMDRASEYVDWSILGAYTK